MLNEQEIERVNDIARRLSDRANTPYMLLSCKSVQCESDTEFLLKMVSKLRKTIVQMHLRDRRYSI